MGFIYGLAVLLVIFEEIIIHCESAPRQKQNAPLNNNLPSLPGEIIEVILSKTDFQTIKAAIGEYLAAPNDIVMSKILRDDLVVIYPNLNQLIFEYERQGDSVLKFGSYGALTSFFDKFGDKIKRLKVDVDSQTRDESGTEITQNIIKKYAKNLEELQISVSNDVRFWKELSNGENHIIFPKVKKLIFRDFACILSVSRLDLIFPKLESVDLLGDIFYLNCLEHVKGLKELILRNYSVQEEQLDVIFANNVNMTKIHLSSPSRTETMHSISKHLTKLKTLEINGPAENFMLLAYYGPVYTLPLVNHFIISFGDTREILGYGNFRIKMPNLKQLTFHSSENNNRIIEFIEQFTELETLELSVNSNDAIDCLPKLKHIKEFRTSNYMKKFPELNIFFETFDEDSQLQRVKFLDFCETTFKYYENDMAEFNNKLKNLGKPTWTLSRGDPKGKGSEYAMFERN